MILIAPYSLNDSAYMTLKDSLQKNYARLNSIKTVVFLTLHVFVYAVFSLLILYETLSLKGLLLLVFTVGLFWLLLFLYYMPCETPFGLVNFGKLYKP